jgi:folate-binding protein YgfZ
MLTPKGRLVTDLRVARLSDGEGGALLLDLPEAGASTALEHFHRYLPPRLARVQPPDTPLDALTLVGPDAAEVLSTEIEELNGILESVDTMGEGDTWLIDDGTLFGPRIVRNGGVAPGAFDVIARAEELDELRARVRGRGVSTAPPLLWETLRLEHGRPAFGVEMDSDTLPAEAGIERRCIDYRKGCFTGQEVVVRIRDRGHVNRQLRGLLLGDVPVPPRGETLVASEGGQPMGQLRSAVRSPRFGQTIGLGYVRREVEPPSELRLGTPQGSAVQVRALGDAGWVLVKGDPSFYP